MRVTKEYIKNLLPGLVLTINCPNAAELDSAYQTALKARKEMGMDKDSMRITRLAKEMKVEVEHYEKEGEA